MLQVIDVHRRTDIHAVWPDSFFQNLFAVPVGVSEETCQGRGPISPMRLRLLGSYPNGSNLKPALGIELPLFVARRVAFGAFGDLLNQIFSARNISIARGWGRSL